MEDTSDLLCELNEDSRNLFQKRQVILSFSGFLEKLAQKPHLLIRNSPRYIYDAFGYFGTTTIMDGDRQFQRWRLFDIGTERHIPIIGSEAQQGDIYNILSGFVRQGFASKLILLHGPNGSAKTSIIESICQAMANYSMNEEGAVYRFNWVFPTDKSSTPKGYGESGPIGFGGQKRTTNDDHTQSFAFLDEAKIASKIHSEYKENPLYLLPMPYREKLLRRWMAAEKDIPPQEIDLPPHVLLGGLSKKNQLIFENLLAAYEGNLSLVLRHVQVERFFYSKQYRVGISTVEPQMSIDAGEKQLTMDRNMANLPPLLHNINFHEAAGPIIEANRGLLEFSDMLKRPLEAYKYLLSTVEKGTLNLPTSTANLDIVFFATTNEKHLDAFKTVPDFASFRSRFELVTAPYLLKPSQEEKIYEADIIAINRKKKVTPHALSMLCLWAVMTRMKQPDPEYYQSKYRSLISRLDPHAKVKLYENQPLTPQFKPQEESLLREMRRDIIEESDGTVVYEGRFGASPREVRAILYKSAQMSDKSLTPMCIFRCLERLIKDRSNYEFLQMEARGKYHQPAVFLSITKDIFAQLFEKEATFSMSLVEEHTYHSLLKRYIDHVVALVKNEKIYNKITGSYEDPSQKLMKDVENILKISGSVERHRETLLGRIAAYRIDNPNKEIDVTIIFHEYLEHLQRHYYGERQKVVEKNFQGMLVWGTDDEKNLDDEGKILAEKTFLGLEERFGYDRHSARECVKFLMKHNSQQK